MRRRSASLVTTRGRLRLVFAAAFCVLAVPTVVLVVQAFKQLELDAFRRQQLEAERVVDAIDASLGALVRGEDARAFQDFGFLVLAGDGGELARSVLSTYPAPTAIPGVLGYFQVDADGMLTTPLLPPDGVAAGDYGVDADELAARRAVAARLRDVLAENRIVRGAAAAPSPAPGAEGRGSSAQPAAEGRGSSAQPVAEEAEAREAIAGQAVFDRLSESAPGSRAARAQTALAPQASAAFELDAAGGDAAGVDAPVERAARARTEQAVVPALKASEAEAGDDARGRDGFRIDVFRSELEPFSFSLLDTGHFVLFRDAWRDEQRFVQGALIEQPAFLEALIAAPFAASPLADNAALALSYAGRALLGTAAANGDDVLLRARLSPPFAELELSLTSSALPPSPGRALLVWLSTVLALVLPAVFLLAYRFSWRQTALARQQQDFVAAVSHELKTPLTSIRMYGEMLKAGWADEAKRRSYYEYIYNESERLSRLIENVLQLARMTRQGLELETRPHGVAELLDLARSKVATRVEQAGFELRTVCDDGLDTTALDVDADSFAQIAINLVDNAVKFSAEAAERAIEIGMHRQRDGHVAFSVRDFGPGVPRRTMRRLFELFYRPDNALSRATAGTGIGLALVKQLAEAMRGKVDVRNREPGAEFAVSFPPIAAASD